MSASALLMPHPATRPDAIREIAVSYVRDAATGALRISWRAHGAIARLRLPDPAPPLRADGLWQHSCFEAFLRSDTADSYHEFNFAPSGAWAAYRFTGRRTGQSAPPMSTPRIETTRDATSFVLTAVLPLDELPELAQATTLRAGLAAVLEDERGSLAYWALAHHALHPDFHDPAAFNMIVPAR